MRRHSILLSLGLAVSALFAHTMDQVLTRQPPSAPNRDSSRIELVPKKADLKTPIVAHSRTSFPTAGSAVPHQSSPPETLKPGSYLTTPFSCIVIVPDTHLDEKMAVDPPGNACPMPTLKPQLEFIPLERK